MTDSVCAYASTSRHATESAELQQQSDNSTASLYLLSSVLPVAAYRIKN